MNIVIEKSALKGEIEAIPSKSYAHRILICSAFSNKETTIYNLPNSQDILATISCLKSLGTEIAINNNVCKVIPTTIKENIAELNVQESGSTLRFFLPIVAALGGEYVLRGTKKLISRPSYPLLNTLKENGIEYEVGLDYIKIKGKLKSANFNIDASLSSQYLTGLMLAIPLLSVSNKIICEKLSSSDYVEITKEILKRFGISVIVDNGFILQGKYTSPTEICVEGDYSNSLFFALAGVLNGEVKIKGLNDNSKQGDKKAFQILKEMGAQITENKDGISFKKSSLKSLNFYGDCIPDAIPGLSLALALANGESVVSGVDRLKFKESDRLNAIITYLTKANIKTYYKNNNLYVNGGELVGGIFDGFNDHRMVMTLTILGSIVGNVEIIGAEAVNKSYPDFFNHFKMLGGKFWIK